jgi:hypothetical protein
MLSPQPKNDLGTLIPDFNPESCLFFESIKAHLSEGAKLFKKAGHK